MLGTPLFNYLNLACALSISERIGATRSCIQRFDAPNNNVLRILITTCTPVLMFDILEQLPVDRVLMSGSIPHLALIMTVARNLVTKTVPAIRHIVFNKMSLRERHVRKLFACSFCGSTDGNQGLKFLTAAKRALSSSSRRRFVPIRTSRDIRFALKVNASLLKGTSAYYSMSRSFTLENRFVGRIYVWINFKT